MQDRNHVTSAIKSGILPQEQMQARQQAQRRERYTSQWHLPKMGTGIPLHWPGCSPPVLFMRVQFNDVFDIYQGSHHNGKKEKGAGKAPCDFPVSCCNPGNEIRSRIRPMPAHTPKPHYFGSGTWRFEVPCGVCPDVSAGPHTPEFSFLSVPCMQGWIFLPKTHILYNPEEQNFFKAYVCTSLIFFTQSTTYPSHQDHLQNSKEDQWPRSTVPVHQNKYEVASLSFKFQQYCLQVWLGRVIYCCKGPAIFRDIRALQPEIIHEILTLDNINRVTGVAFFQFLCKKTPLV